MGRGGVVALKGLDLVVPRGETFGLLGPNGAGKTTLVKLLLGIAFPSAGKGSVLGRPTGDVPTRRRVGYLPENHRYPPHLTGEQVLHHFGRLSGLRRPERARRVDALLRRVRMEEWRAVRVHKYSKGMMQRLGMAQAILNEPELLILDEPTDGVDPIGRREIRDLLLEQKARGATIFLNSHLLSEVERLCDRVAILNEGALLREGSVAELTRPQSAWQIDARPAAPDTIQAACRRVPGASVAEGRVQILGDVAALNALIDALRGQGVEILSITPRRDSLEDVFVKVLSEGEAA
ncbi:MAG TPA: ABC transporter ATP-binding protein [Candidatus Polarisedimenticolia bacterium]|jgi:ABC-2 type transport system ATP-binding protein|nr:ABC transporter ATP-binding protein [Candidatus Polarisedimenticolia bacterium]